MIRQLKQLRMRLLVMLTHNVALPILKILRRPMPFPYTVDELGQFPEGTLGRDLHGFLAAKGLLLLWHYSRHDMKHIVLNYDTTEKIEACLQSFMLGNGRVILSGACNCSVRLSYHAGVLEGYERSLSKRNRVSIHPRVGMESVADRKHRKTQDNHF